MSTIEVNTLEVNGLTNPSADPRLAAVATVVSQINSVRPGEIVPDDGERWSVAAAAQHLGEHPESIRAAMAVLRLGYRSVFDGVGFIDASTLIRIARWLSEQDQDRDR